MASTHAYVRAFHVPRSDLCTLVTEVHSALERELDDDRFVSFLIARLDIRDHVFTFVNAGHPPGYVIDASGSIVAKLGASTWGLAMLPHISPHNSVPIPLNEGELVLLTSDGLTEATSPSDEEFGLDRVLETVRLHLREPAVEIIEALHQSLVEFTGRTKPEDDVTIVVLKRRNEAT